MIGLTPNNGSSGTPTPLQLFLELTSACNLSCSHCYVSAGEGETRGIPGPLLQQLLLEFQALGGVYATFSGGEPTLHKAWKPAMRFARFIGLDTMLLTNGTTLRAQDIAFLRELDSQVAISLDAGNATSHDAIRGVGSFEKTLARLEQLSAIGMGSKVTLCFTPMACNYWLLPEIVSIADHLGIGTVYLSLLEDRGRAKSGFGGITLDSDALLQLLYSIVSLQERYPDVFIECLNLKYFPERLRGIELDADTLDRTIRVTADAEVYLTAYLYDPPFQLGRYSPGTLSGLWYGEKVERAFSAASARADRLNSCKSCDTVEPGAEAAVRCSPGIEMARLTAWMSSAMLRNGLFVTWWGKRMHETPLSLTDLAADKIKEFATGIADTNLRNLRVDIVGGAESGFAYDLLFDAVQPEDRIIESHGITIIVRPDCISYLSGSTIDWIDSDNGSGFQVVNPNEP